MNTGPPNDGIPDECRPAVVLAGQACIVIAEGFAAGMITQDWSTYDHGWDNLSTAINRMLIALSGADHELGYYQENT